MTVARQASKDHRFVTAVYTNSSGVQVPVGCTDLNSCVALRAAAFTTGVGLIDRTPPPPPPPPPPLPSVVALAFHVDVSGYDRFQPSIFSDALLEVVQDQLGGPGAIATPALQGKQTKVCSEDARNWFYVCKEVAWALLKRVVEPDGAVSQNSSAVTGSRDILEIVVILVCTRIYHPASRHDAINRNRHSLCADSSRGACLQLIPCTGAWSPFCDLMTCPFRCRSLPVGTLSTSPNMGI